MGEISESDKLFVQGISAETTKDCLQLYIERISDLDVKDIQYGGKSDESDNAIVTFDSTMDFNKIQGNFEKRPTLEGKRISIKRVPLCKTILVKNLPPSATHDSVMYRFENRRAGGGEVEDGGVKLDLEKKIATIEFKDANVIDQVLSLEQTLDGTTLSVERYYPILNNLADFTKQDSSEPPRRRAPIPKPRKQKVSVSATDVDRDLYDYLTDNHPAELHLALKDPQPNIEIKEESVHFTFSSQDAKEHFLKHLENYKCEIVPVNLALVGHGLPDEIQGTMAVFNLPKSVSFIERYNEGFIKLVGRAVRTFDLAIEEVKKCIDKVEDRINQHDDVIEILPVHLKLLQRSTNFQRFETSLKRDGCEIQIDDRIGKITVKGSQTQIQRLKVQIQDIVGRFGERSLNQNKFSLLRTREGLSQVKTLFSTENESVVILVNDQGNVMLYGLDKATVQQACDTIENALEELKLPSSLHTKSSQDAFLDELGTSIPVSLLTDGGQPRIICFKKQSGEVKKKIDDFSERKKPVEVRVPLDKAVLRFLILHGETLLESLRLSSPGLQIEQGSDGFVVSGERLPVSNCCISIQQFTRGLKFERMNYGTPEIAASIKGRATMAIIQNIERKHRCAIVVTTREDVVRRPRSSTSPVHNVHNLNENRKRTMQCRYIFPNGKVIEIHQGDILSHPVDYLVNSANEELKHGGGLAGAIVEKGGWKIQEDSTRALRDQNRDKLLPAEVVATDGGKLMCKKVLHVVVPKYNKRTLDRDEENSRVGMYLKQCCTNVLKNATHGQTIAIPALGTGIYTVPFEISAKNLVEAATEYLQENPNLALKEVHFVDNEPATIEALMKEMVKRFKHELNFEINDSVRDRWKPYLRETARATSIPTTVAPSGDMVFKTPEGMEIRLTIGNIAKSTTQVIVNTVSSDLNLTKNPCSKAILHEAGSNMATLCEKWIKDNKEVKDGEFAITNGAKLKCRKVFHVSCPTWAADQGEKKLRELVQKILDKVQALSLASISIPALGTGTLNFPEELVAKVLFEEAMKFSSKHGASLKIKEFNVVVYNGNTKAVSKFKEQFQVYSNKKITNEPKVHKTTRPKSRMSLSRKTVVKDRVESSEDETKGVEVEIVQGNIVEESTDAIGFLVSEDIEQGGQIGQALVRKAGESLAQEYRTLGKIEPGTVVMTAAGNLQTHCLLHMVIKNAFMKTDKSMIQSAVKQCLNQANEYGLTSLSLPAVGTGHLKKDAKQSAEILYSCIKEYRKRNEKTLKLIRIVILQENIFVDFKKAFEKKDPTTTSADFKGGERRRQQITLTIAAESDNDMTKIMEELRQVEAEQSHSETIETRQRLDERQQDEILNIEDLHDVRIECQPEIGFIRISGLAKNVSVAVGAIHERIHAWDQERHHMDKTVREVQWLFYQEKEDSVIPERYSDSISAKIERAYQNDKSGTVEVGEDLKYKIDFKTMIETCVNTNETMKVYRRDCEAFPLPSHWEFQPIDRSTGKEHDVYSFPIEKNTAEYDHIHDRFIASLSQTTPNAEVVKIERIQNPRLYQIYEGQKKKMIDGGNEMKLYHGTAKNAVENINKTGFNRAYCGKNAVRFGKGVYFAKEAWYSARKVYAALDDKGLQYVYVARVLVGKFTKGKEGLIVPPTVDENNQTVVYDSVADDVQKPTMFIIFYDYQSYPEYLITFKPN